MATMSQRSEQNTGTREVGDACRFDEQRLLDYLLSHVESFRGPLTVSQFKAGQSNPKYCQRTGRDQGIANRNFYSAFNFFRLAAILQGIAGRVRDGTAASAHAAQAVKAVEPLATMGWRYAEKE
ncbi:MAG: hypothetical protein ACR2RD_18195 [Woeseiaceae bacterium]